MRPTSEARPMSFSEVFVESVQQAATAVGFIIVGLVGGVAEMASALSAARKNSIALGSAVQIALFVAPVLGFSAT
jgi:Ca2+:H+ antiporter